MLPAAISPKREAGGDHRAQLPAGIQVLLAWPPTTVTGSRTRFQPMPFVMDSIALTAPPVSEFPCTNAAYGRPAVSSITG